MDAFGGWGTVVKRLFLVFVCFLDIFRFVSFLRVDRVGVWSAFYLFLLGFWVCGVESFEGFFLELR